MGRGSVVSGSSKGVHTSSKKRHTILTFPKIRLCLHSTGQLLRRHENHTGYGFSFTHKDGDFGDFYNGAMLCRQVHGRLLDRCSYYTR